MHLRIHSVRIAHSSKGFSTSKIFEFMSCWWDPFRIMKHYTQTLKKWLILLPGIQQKQKDRSKPTRALILEAKHLRGHNLCKWIYLQFSYDTCPHYMKKKNVFKANDNNVLHIKYLTHEESVHHWHKEVKRFTWDACIYALIHHCTNYHQSSMNWDSFRIANFLTLHLGSQDEMCYFCT